MPTGVYLRTKENTGCFKKGIIPWNAGKKGVMPTPWNKGKSGEYSIRHDKQFKPGQSPWNKGIDFMQDDAHPMWKGEDVKYRGLHMWVVSKLGQPGTCEHCNKSGLSGRQIHWANKSHKYLRDLSDWIRLCAGCHKAYDRAEA